MMARPTANLRLFVAIHPPPEIAAALLEAIKALELPPHRPTLPEQVHLTLQFIGDTPAKAMEETSESVRRAAAGIKVFALQPLHLMTLPERGAARLVAAQTDAPGQLMEMHRRLVLRLARNVRSRQEERFRPHLTLGRFRAPTRIAAIEHPLTLPAFPVERIVLMRSVLLPDGSRHHEVVRCDLEG